MVKKRTKSANPTPEMQLLEVWDVSVSPEEVAVLQNMNRASALKLTDEGKKKYFKVLRIGHLRMGEAAEQMLELITAGDDTSIIALIGATGTGKSTLVETVLQAVIEALGTRHSGDPSKIAVIYVKAPANGAKSISWSAFYEKILEVAREILIDRKVSSAIHGGVVTMKRGLDGLRCALESMFRNRGVQVLAVDEAYHMLRFGNYGALMDTLKSLADTGGVKLVLVGTYELYKLFVEYGQVARRGEVVHFKRYLQDEPADKALFKEIVKKFQDEWPCNDVPDLEAISDLLLEASLGCVGNLKGILQRLLHFQLNNKGRFKTEMLKRACKSNTLLRTIHQEIQNGEGLLAGSCYGDSLFSGQVLNAAAKLLRVPLAKEPTNRAVK